MVFSMTKSVDTGEGIKVRRNGQEFLAYTVFRWAGGAGSLYSGGRKHAMVPHLTALRYASCPLSFMTSSERAKVLLLWQSDFKQLMSPQHGISVLVIDLGICHSQTFIYLWVSLIIIFKTSGGCRSICFTWRVLHIVDSMMHILFYLFTFQKYS